MGVYASFTGLLPQDARLWAAVLRAGPEAVISHQTAAGLYGILDDRSQKIHVTVPQERHLRSVAGLVVHRSVRLREVTHPAFLPPRASLEETVFDLTNQMTRFDDVVALLARACQRQQTVPPLLVKTMNGRSRIRWRKEIGLALVEIEGGAHSVLELRYLRNVERAHGLPASDRQAPGTQHGTRVFRDIRYSRYRVIVELDGKASHPDAQRWKDKYRDNAAAADGYVSLRYGWADVGERACETSLEVATVLSRQGWTGTLRRCGPACRLPR